MTKFGDVGGTLTRNARLDRGGPVSTFDRKKFIFVIFHILKSRFPQPRPNGSLDFVLISHTGVEIDEDDGNRNAKKI